MAEAVALDVWAGGNNRVFFFFHKKTFLYILLFCFAGLVYAFAVSYEI